MTEKITIGFIPLADAASLLAAADFGFAEGEGLGVELVREVSWANVREKLSAGIFDAAHLLAPMAVASALDLMPGSVPLTAPYVLAINGNAITVSGRLYQDIAMRLEREPATPLATAHALSWIIAERKKLGKNPLTFGTTFPFSCHTYQLRFWMAAGGIDTAEDVRIISLPPPYMVESLKSGEVDGFCVGAPWNSLAVDLGLGHILHFGSEIVQRLTEKVIAARIDWLHHNEEKMIRLMRAVSAAAVFTSQPKNWATCCERLSAPDRIGAGAHLIKRGLSGSLKVGPDGILRTDDRYLIFGAGRRARPDAAQAAWFYSQMVRWGQARLEPGLSETAQGAFSPALFDRAFSKEAIAGELRPQPADGLGTFAGPSFDKDRIADYLAGSLAS
jgi:two-component system, oxyanion-binding sensor